MKPNETKKPVIIILSICAISGEPNAHLRTKIKGGGVGAINVM
jgi:hypothetical protein